MLALRAIREALVLPYAALRVDGADLAASGTAVTHTRPSRSTARSGELVVGLRPGDLTLSPGRRARAASGRPAAGPDPARPSSGGRPAGVTGQTITALEEERRRLRRDLHDGLGPRLSGIAFTSDAARNLRSDPDGTDALLRTLRAETVSAIEEIRRLVYAMRPPALDELGLVPALRSRPPGCDVDGGPLRVTVDRRPTTCRT